MGRRPCCDKSKVKRGTWSPEEDNILKNYMYKHGGTTGGNWATLPQKAGLKRCGKSCRLRWLNYLRPDIKHGAFTQEDENVICSLYNKIGSRWAHIASQLPGRTDNDVKNYWNTNLKKKQPVITASSSHQKSTIPKSTVTVSPSRTTADNFRASTNYSPTPPLLAGSLSPPPENNSGYLKAHDRILGQELVDPRSIIDSSTTSTAKSHKDYLHHDPSVYSGIDELFAFDQNPELGNGDSSYCAFGGIWTQEEAVTEADSNEDLFSILHSLSSGI